MVMSRSQQTSAHFEWWILQFSNFTEMMLKMWNAWKVYLTRCQISKIVLWTCTTNTIAMMTIMMSWWMIPQESDCGISRAWHLSLWCTKIASTSSLQWYFGHTSMEKWHCTNNNGQFGEKYSLIRLYNDWTAAADLSSVKSCMMKLMRYHFDPFYGMSKTRDDVELEVFGRLLNANEKKFFSEIIVDGFSTWAKCLR